MARREVSTFDEAAQDFYAVAAGDTGVVKGSIDIGENLGIVGNLTVSGTMYAKVSAMLKTRGITGITSIVFKKREGWERTVQAAYTSETRPTWRFLGDYATATLAWAAAYLGVPTVSGDYYWNTTNKRQEQCTTTNNSTVVFRGAQNYLPDECVFVSSISGIVETVFIFDLTDPLMPLWMQLYSGANTLYPGTTGTPVFTACKLVWDSVKRRLWWGTGPSALAGSMLGYIDFMDGSAGYYSGSAYRVFAGTLEARHSALAYKTLSTAAGYLISADYIADVACDAGYTAAATSAGVSVVKPDGSTLKSSSTNAFKSVAILRGRLYAINDTASPEQLNDYGPIAELTASFAPVNTWTNATVPALSDSTLTKVVAAGDHLVIHGSTAVDELWPDTTTMANSLIARKYTTAATVPMKKPELMILAGTGTGSITPTDLITNGTFPTDVSSWTNQSSNTITWSAGAAVLTRAIGEGNENVAAQTISVVAGRTYLITYSGLTGVTGSNPFGIYIGGSLLGQVTNNTPVAIRYTATTTGSVTFYLAIRGSTPAGSPYVVGVDNVSMVEYVADHSGKSNHATINGTLTATAHATGGVAMASGFTATTNFLNAPNPWDGIGSGDGWIGGTFKVAASAVTEWLFQLGYYDGAANLNAIVFFFLEAGGQARFNASNDAYATNVQILTASTYDDGLVHTWHVVKTSTHYYLYIDGKLVGSVAVGAHGTLTFHASAKAWIGKSANDSSTAPNSSVALSGGGKVALTQTEIELEHLYMRNLIEGKAAFDELPSNLAYNELTDTIHCVGTTYEQTMRDGRVTVVGSHGVGTSPVIACGPRGEVSYGGSTNLTISVPERNLAAATLPKYKEYKEFNFTGDTTTVDFSLEAGWKPVSVYEDGALATVGAAKDTLFMQTAFLWFVRFAVAPAAVPVTILAERTV